MSQEVNFLPPNNFQKPLIFHGNASNRPSVKVREIFAPISSLLKNVIVTFYVSEWVLVQKNEGKSNESRSSKTRGYNDLWKFFPEKEVILFGDDVHPTMATKVSYGWIRKGQETYSNKSLSNTFKSYGVSKS